MSEIIMKRRSFLIGGLASLFAAPAIVRAASLMKVRPYVDMVYSPWEAWTRNPITEEEWQSMMAMPNRALALSFMQTKYAVAARVLGGVV